MFLSLLFPNGVRLSSCRDMTNWPLYKLHSKMRSISTSRQLAFAFTPEFYENETRIKQWNAFCNKNKSYVQEANFGDVVARLASFLVPVIKSVQQQRALESAWKPANAWHPAPRQ